MDDNAVKSPVDPEVLTLLGKASTATITTQLLKRGLRNTFLAGLAPLNPTATRLVAEAFTLRYIPAREDIDIVEAFDDYDHPQRRAIESATPGHVLVMDCRGQNRAASAGHILVTRLAHRGVAGLITDGAVRDSHRIAQVTTPVFCAGASAMTNLAQHHAVDMQVPIGCAGVPVFPGDIMVSDDEGVVCVPREYAGAIAEQAVAQEELEEFLLRQVANGAPLRGTYPPDERTLAEYANHAVT